MSTMAMHSVVPQARGTTTAFAPGAQAVVDRIPLRPNPLCPLKEKTTGHNDGGFGYPPVVSLRPGESGHNGAQRGTTTLEGRSWR